LGILLPGIEWSTFMLKYEYINKEWIVPPTAGRVYRASTDAPLIPTQLKRIAKRVKLGLGRDGSYSGDGSGDIFIAFSTANSRASSSHGLRQITMLPNDQINPFFLATVQATEEALINALVAAETMTGFNGHTVVALPHGRLREVLQKYNRLLPMCPRAVRVLLGWRSHLSFTRGLNHDE